MYVSDELQYEGLPIETKELVQRLVDGGYFGEVNEDQEDMIEELESRISSLENEIEELHEELDELRAA